MRKLERNCTLIGASSHIGQTKAGVEAAPGWLRHHKVFDHLETEFSKIIDRGDKSPEEIATLIPGDDPLHLLSQYSQSLAYNIERELYEDNFVLTIGGDHSVAIGTVAGSYNFDENIKIIWVDAHADINTFETSPSGNTHGMPLAWHLQLMDQVHQIPFHWLKKIKKENIVYIGLRDVDAGEQTYLDKLGIKYYTAKDIKEIGIKEALREIDLYFTKSPGNNIHISFDVDGIDPEFFPATGTPVGEGLHLKEGKKIISHFYQNYNLIALDLVEINPALGDEEDLQRTIDSTKDLLSALRKDNVQDDLDIVPEIESDLNITL